MEPVHPALASDVAENGTEPITVPTIIGGREEILAASFDVISPYTGKVAWRCSSATTSDAIRAVEAAKAAFPAWSSTKPEQRRLVLLKAADIMEERLHEIAAIMRTEMGADEGSSAGFVTPLGIRMLRDCAARTTSIEGRVPTTEPDGQNIIVHKVPVGPVLGIVPWNAPSVFANRSIATALAAGCTTIIKASEITPRCYWAIAKCYIDAGVPPGALNVLYCRPEDAGELARVIIEHPAIRKINFTGSTNVGRKVAVTCAQNLKPCLMELGGKNSAIVLDDANLETAATQAVIGSFVNSGQICMSTDRIIVHEKVLDKFQDVFGKVLGAIFPATNPPPTISTAASKERIMRAIEQAKTGGAHVTQGGWNTPDENQKLAPANGGVFLRPVVMQNVKPDMKVWEEEMFGSIVSMAKAASEEEAIEMANDTGYGLSAAIFTENLQRGMRVAKQIDAGIVHINRMTVQDDPAFPFGGVKMTGWGRFNSKEGLEEFLTTKSITWMD